MESTSQFVSSFHMIKNMQFIIQNLHKMCNKIERVWQMWTYKTGACWAMNDIKNILKHPSINKIYWLIDDVIVIL